MVCPYPEELVKRYVHDAKQMQPKHNYRKKLDRDYKYYIVRGLWYWYCATII